MTSADGLNLISEITAYIDNAVHSKISNNVLRKQLQDCIDVYAPQELKIHYTKIGIYFTTCDNEPTN